MSRKWFWTGIICLAGAALLSNKKVREILDDIFSAIYFKERENE